MKATILAALPLLASVSTVGQSAVVIEMNDSQGTSRIYADGPKAHMQMSGGNEYMVINAQDNTAYLVNPDEKSVVDMSGFLNNAPPAEPAGTVRSELKRKGDGPEIAGYNTIEYEMLANGQRCGIVFASQDAMKKSGIREFAEMFSKMAARGSVMANQFGMNQDPCIAAAGDSARMLKKTGLAMRSLDKNGALQNEVTRIDPNAKLPANAFSVPQNYARQDMAQMQQEAEQEMQQHMPQIEQMMKQMQQSGEMPPGAQEQMEQMMKRYQPR